MYFDFEFVSLIDWLIDLLLLLLVQLLPDWRTSLRRPRAETTLRLLFWLVCSFIFFEYTNGLFFFFPLQFFSYLIEIHSKISICSCKRSNSWLKSKHVDKRNCSVIVAGRPSDGDFWIILFKFLNFFFSNFSLFIGTDEMIKVRSLIWFLRLWFTAGERSLIMCLFLLVIEGNGGRFSGGFDINVFQKVHEAGMRLVFSLVVEYTVI